MVKSFVNRKGYDGILRCERNSQIGGHLLYYRYLRYIFLLPFSVDSKIQDCREAKIEHFHIGLLAHYKQIICSVFSEFYGKAKKYSFLRKNNSRSLKYCNSRDVELKLTPIISVNS